MKKIVIIQDLVHGEHDLSHGEQRVLKTKTRTEEYLEINFFHEALPNGYGSIEWY